MLWFSFEFSKDHISDSAKAKTEALAFQRVVRESGHFKPSDVQYKKNKQADSVLSGKRVLDMKSARALAPPGAYLYETVDGTRIRVFYGRFRISTSAMVAVGKPLAVLHCLKWSWRNWEKEQNQGGGQGDKCPHDFTKIKTQ